MRFEWNALKATANLRKHGISFDEAASVSLIPCRQLATIRIIRSTKGVS